MLTIRAEVVILATRLETIDKSYTKALSRIKYLYNNISKNRSYTKNKRNYERD